MIATFSGFSPWSDEVGRPLSLMSDAGTLSAAHAGFKSNEGCGSCHKAHRKSGPGWLAAAFSDQDMSEGCLGCHRFEGDARAPHQDASLEHRPGKKAVPEVQCTVCHSEHLGKHENISAAALASCRNCHQQTIVDFVKSHPEFDASYPYSKPHTIYFDHKSHIGEYFVEDEWLSKPNRDARFAKRAAKACTTCHEVEGATRAVVPKTFEAMCAGCHQQQIHDRPLITMTGDEAAPVLMALAAAVDNEQADDAEALAKSTIEQMKEGSVEPLMDMTGDASARLWSGISATEIKAAAEAWAAEEDFESPMPELQQAAGWHSGENDDGDQSLFYRATEHADPIVKAWIENFVGQVQAQNETPLSESMSEALDSLLDAKSGAGACGKCHAAGIRQALVESGGGKILWGYQMAGVNRHTPYKHGPHISLTGDKEGCDACHTFAKGANVGRYFENQGVNPEEFDSAFEPISREICTECHNPRQISDSCLTCHKYHGKSDFRIGFMPGHEATAGSESTDGTPVGLLPVKTSHTSQPDAKASQDE